MKKLSYCLAIGAVYFFTSGFNLDGRAISSGGLASGAFVSGAFVSAAFSSGDEDYKVSRIPQALMEDADAVIRLRFLRFEVKSEKKATKKVKTAVTIFKKDERQYGRIVLPYDKFREIEELEGRIIDSEGNEIRELSSGEIKDYSATADFSLYADTRVKAAELYYDKYPYTVEFTYEISYNGYIDWPDWYSRASLDAVEQSAYEVVIPKENELRFWCNQDSVKPEISTEGNKKIYQWKALNQPKLSKDAAGDDIEDIALIVQVAPEKFEIDGYRGVMTTWKDFGLWFNSLCKEKDQLPESAVKDIHSLITPEGNTVQKIGKLYNYMQSRTRYVSIQLGIGGWQPFDSKYVHEKGYGDCKALSNYMVSILKEAGIKAYIALINSGDHRIPIVKNFPSNQFNHAIACVPLEKDTLWLECTSQTAPLGEIGWANENRSALLITDQGGVLVETPRTKPEENVQVRCGKVEISTFGSTSADVSVKWNGDQQGYVRNSLDEATPEERERWVVSSLSVPDSRIESFHLEGIDTKNSEGNLSVKVNLPSYVSVSGNRLFFQPNLMEKRTYVPKDVSVRLSPVRFLYPYKDIDTISYAIPKGYSVEAIPGEVKLKTSFGSFTSRTTAVSDSLIVFTRELEISDYSIPASNYAEYRKFFSDIVKADRAQVVLVKKAQ